MNISFKNLRTLALPKKKKDGGISLARSTRAWITLLCGACVLLAGGAVFAAYMFYVATDTAHVVVTDPVETVRYQSTDIGAALRRYDELRAQFSAPIFTPASTTPPLGEATAPQGTTVATHTPVRVE